MTDPAADSRMQAYEPQVMAYNTLDTYLTSQQDHVVEVEILPPTIQPPNGFIMAEGQNLGIPSKVLAAAFIEARRVFFALSEADRTSLTALPATRIMLLFDPEHLTAANSRKRYLLAMKATDDSRALQTAVQRELILLNTVLTSPLHRQSKSPTLWHHRFFLLDFILPPKAGQPPRDHIRDFMHSELDAVSRSGKQHPHNYYAWQYARRLFSKADIFPPSTAKSMCDTDGNHCHCSLSYISAIRTWCFKHPSDISGWSFLLFLLRESTSSQAIRDTVMAVLEYAINLRMAQESLWVFIRTALAGVVLEEDRVRFVQMMSDHRIAIAGNPRASLHIDRVARTLNWIGENSGKSFQTVS